MTNALTPANYPQWLEFNAELELLDLDLAFGRFLYKLSQGEDVLAVRLAVLCSFLLQNGNTNLDLELLYTDPNAVLPLNWQTETAWPEFLPKDLTDCLNLIKQANFIGDGSGPEPLVLDHKRLYLARFWHASKSIYTKIHKLTEHKYVFEPTDVKQIKGLLDLVFAANNTNDFTDWQKIACATALLSDFTIITGGPGTGKTTTVVNLLAVIQALAVSTDKPYGARIQLAAPTGKAAARLNESISGAIGRLATIADAQIKTAVGLVPTQVVTLHSLLGTKQNSRLFKHDQNNKLDLDVLVVDEASMMDIEMFAALLQALPDNAKLILLGDKDQLASVEAGAVLGELCARSQAGHYTQEHSQLIEDLTGEVISEDLQDEQGSSLDQAVVMLRQSYRFNIDSGIGQLASAINNSNLDLLEQLLQGRNTDLDFVALGAQQNKWLDLLFNEQAYPKLFQMIRDFESAQASREDLDAWALAILRQQAYIQVLCVVREGKWGVKGINVLIENTLKYRNLVPKYARNWYAGRPVMFAKNRHDLGLANGDIGICLPVPDVLDPSKTVLRVAFLAAEADKVRWLAPARLAEVETVYALTVHKSQGSEFNHVVLVMPDKINPILTKELLYTGVTRAKDKFSLVMPSGADVFLQAAKRQINRSKSILI